MSAESVGLYDCWFCRRERWNDDLIAGYDTFDEQRLACSDCDRTLRAMAARGFYFQRTPLDPDPRYFEDDPPPDPRSGVRAFVWVLLAAVLVLLLAVVTHPWTAR